MVPPAVGSRHECYCDSCTALKKGAALLKKFSPDRLRLLLNRIRERLWVRPLAVCLLSIAMAFVARLADGTGLARFVPDVKLESTEKLLSIMAASMLVIATFSVASMVSAYASASSNATPRSYTLVIADDGSQNALSTFIGAFIFSIVAITAAHNSYFAKAGQFVLFSLTIIVFGIVILTFVRWVDRIAHLGRLGSIIDRVEKAAADAIRHRRRAPTLRALSPPSGIRGDPVFSSRVGYLQHVDVAALQAWAETAGTRVDVAALPGTFVAPGRPLAFVLDGSDPRCADRDDLVDAFQIGDDRRFEQDPRFGLVVLSEIAGRALSPAINDPGTAIDIIGTMVRLFTLWCEPVAADDRLAVKHDRVTVPELSIRDLFDDAFTVIARDGAGAVEVLVRLQKALNALAASGDAEMRAAANHHGRLALKRAEARLDLDEDLAAVRAASGALVESGN